MEINDSVTLYVKSRGAVADLTKWTRICNGIYYDEDFDPIDGAQWNGSADTLLDLDNWRNIQKVAPKIIFDFGELCGYTNFNYVVIPSFWSGMYGVYALTNNETILQSIGYLYISSSSSYSSTYGYIDSGNYNNISFVFTQIPNENYVPEDHDLVEFVTTSDGKTYEYSGLNEHFNFAWTNTLNSEPGFTYNRNPVIGDCINKLNNSAEIESITCYSGKELPSPIDPIPPV